MSLEIHHKEYPITSQGILSAIKNKNIFYLCNKHHPRGKNAKVSGVCDTKTKKQNVIFDIHTKSIK